MGSGDDPANILSMEGADKSLPLPTDYPPCLYTFSCTSSNQSGGGQELALGDNARSQQLRDLLRIREVWVANYYSARNPLRLSSLVILGVVARMFRCATRSSCWCT